MKKDLATLEEFNTLSKEEKVEQIQEAVRRLQLLRKFEETKLPPYNKCQDFSEKVMGDRVEFISKVSLGYLWDTKTGKICDFDSDIEKKAEIFFMKAIVGKSGLKKRLICSHCPSEHVADLLIYFPETKEEFYTIGSLVKVIED